MSFNKTLLLVFACCFQFAAHAQLKLEHTYGPGTLSRIRLDVSGERYLLSQNCQLGLFETDHQPWKSVTLHSPAELCAGYQLTENLIDQDADIETIFNWSADDFSACPPSGTVFEDDNSKQMFVDHNYPGARFSTEAGLEPKLLAGPRVYSLPGLAEEHHYGSDNYVYRMQFPFMGERYLVYNWGDDFTGYHLYKPDHSLDKTIQLPMDGFYNLDWVSQDYFNNDSLLEFAGIQYVQVPAAERSVFKIVQENGNVLFSFPCESYTLSSIPGLDDQLIFVVHDAAGKLVTRIVDPKTFETLHTFPERVARTSADGISAIFLNFSTSLEPVFRIYGPDYALYKVVTPPSYLQHFWNVQVAQRNLFSTSGKLEFCLNSFKDNTYRVACINEDGQVQYDFPKARSFKLLPAHLWVVYPDSTQVYRFLSTSTAAFVPDAAEQAVLTVSPNPFVDGFEIKAPDLIESMQVLDAGGRILFQNMPLAAATINVDAKNWPKGVYFIQCKGKFGTLGAKMVK
ncbi:MAG: T9SS type A sorting domain-containing protein [Saprospiraceae bacterium]|nr:T9SS type A sorting domain-containing protein [Saprospiraceae bacterium]